MLEGKDYLKSIISFGAAPTIKGKKPLSLITFKNNNKNLVGLWKKYGKDICRELELQNFVLKDKPHNSLVLFYKKGMLERYLNKKRNLLFW